jgi:magnesium chelatase family protein
MDRIDIHVEVPALEFNELTSKEGVAGQSRAMAQSVRGAREVQHRRFKDKKINCNASMSSQDLESYCEIGTDSERLLESAIKKIGLSARAYDRIRKVARTIADLTGEEGIQTEHIAEAVQYRSLDKEVWM